MLVARPIAPANLATALEDIAATEGLIIRKWTNCMVIGVQTGDATDTEALGADPLMPHGRLTTE